MPQPGARVSPILVGRDDLLALSERRIAEAVSPKTVGAHVEHILAKLGVSRRAEIAAWVSAVRPAAGVAPDQLPGVRTTVR